MYKTDIMHLVAVLMVTVILMEIVAGYSTCRPLPGFSCELISPRCVTSDIVCTSGDYSRCVNRRRNKTLICCKCDRFKEYNCTVSDTNTLLMESDCVNDNSQNENINEHYHGNTDDHDIKRHGHPNSNVKEKGDNKDRNPSENDSHRITHTEGPNETIREHTKGNNNDHDIKRHGHPNSNVDEKGDNKDKNHSENDSHGISHTEGPNETIREHTKRKEKGKYTIEEEVSSSSRSSSSSSCPVASCLTALVLCLLLTVIQL